jgi:uncharacterized membrane protein YgdD (TMEM256/DUF423 family)
VKGGNGLIVTLAALSGAMAVGAGAFGAHGETGRAAEWLRTGGLYQMVHAVAALAVLGLPRGRLAAWLFVCGAGIFSGALYAMAFGAPRWFGAVPPVGGFGMILGWVMLAFNKGGGRPRRRG